MTDEKNDTPESEETGAPEATEGAESETGGDSTDVPPTEAVKPAKAPRVPRLSVLFPLIVTVVHLATTFYFIETSTTPFRTYVGIGIAPLVAAVLLLGWWLLSLSIPLKERLVGVGAAALAVAVPLLTARPFDVFYLIYLLPAVTTAVVVMAVATQGMAWEAQRKGLLVALGLCAVAFCLLHVVGVNGNMAPLLGWRWEGADPIVGQENKVAAVPKTAAPTDWPGFRGAEREGRNRVDTFGLDWENNPPKELWRRPVGPGWSSFAVVGDYCFTQEQRGEQEAVVCYAVATGEQVWINLVEARFVERMGNGPRATPTFHKGMLYTQGATGILQCIDAATGATQWQRDIAEDADTRIPTWGFCSSPLVVNDLVITYSAAGDGKSLLAYNAASGEPVWTAGKGGNGYVSPQFGEVALTPQVLISSNYGIEAFDPKTGAPLWDQEWDIRGNPRVAQPFVMDLYSVIGGGGQGKGARLIKADVNAETKEWTTKTIWTSNRFRPYFNDFVYYYGFCYGYDGNRLACMDTTDGKVRWTGDRVGGQILLLSEFEMLLVLTEAGEVLVIPAFPEEGNIIARMQALNGKTWNHPVVSGGKLFVRNDSEAVCYELPPAPVEEVTPEAEAEAAH